MRKTDIRIAALALVIPVLFLGPPYARAQAGKAAYRAMAPLDQYLMPDEKSEIALARSAAPPSISDAAEVMVLRRDGYRTAEKGSNGFVCIVERSWAKPTDDAEFWNPEGARPPLLQCGRVQNVPAHLYKENQTCAGGKIEGADSRYYDVRIGTQGTAAAGSRSDVLHDGQAAISQRRR